MLIDALSKLKPEKQIIVGNLGFSSILDFSCSSNIDQIFEWLMNRFDTKSSTFTLENGFSFTITPSFVYNILGFPYGPYAVQMISNPEDYEFVTELLNGQKPTVEYLCSLLTMDLDALTFSRIFMLLIIEAFIAPTPTGSISHLLYHYVVNINTVSTLDWCSFTLQFLLNSIDTYQSNKEKGIEEEIGGCKLILVVSIQLFNLLTKYSLFLFNLFLY
jgi:hypothetical protein